MKLKEKLITALSSLPLIAATTISGSCAAGCPYGLVNCAYPGQCPRYSDSGGDGICDLSQSSSSGTNTETAYASSSNSDTSSSGSTQPSTITQDQSDQVSSASSDSGNTNPPEDANASVITDPGAGLDNGNVIGGGNGYHVLPVSIFLISAYLFTHYLFTRGILKRQKHRRIWNLLVTAGYAGTGITGVLLVLIVNLGIRTALNPSITFWHAELAILMVVGTLIHIHLYWKPFKNIFRVLFGLKTQQKKNKPAKS